MRPWRKKTVKDKRSEWFFNNGSIFLQELIADSNGISNPIRTFSSDQILKATNRFDPIVISLVMGFSPGTKASSKTDLTPSRNSTNQSLKPRGRERFTTTSSYLLGNWKAKLTDFTFSVTLPEGKSWIEDKVMGTLGYMDPIYFSTGLVTEYTDVFSFGIFMLVLLMGRQAVFGGPSGVRCSILDYVKDLRERGEPDEFGGDSDDMRPGQMKMFLELAL